MQGDILAFWSLMALIVRAIAILAFGYVAVLQFKQFRKPDLYKFEGRLKKLLFYFSVIIGISNLPVMYLHYVRINHIVASPAVTSFATVTNALSMLMAAGLLVMIYLPMDNDS